MLVQYEVSESGLGTLTLERADKLNALSAQLVQETTALLEKAALDATQGKLRVLILRSSTPKAFCVGADLSERLKMDEGQVLGALDGLARLTTAAEALSCPTIAVVEGAAFGGGLELALCCDLRVMTPASSVGLTETRLAIIPGAGGTQRLARLVGVAKAMELILAAKRIGGEEAARIGLANVCVDDALSWARDFAQACLEAGPVALLAAKEAIRRGYAEPLKRGLQIEREQYGRVLKTQDRIEGLKAFSEKRSPRYQGK
jgi:methylglutaconyl-CoA hydratase